MVEIVNKTRARPRSRPRQVDVQRLARALGGNSKTWLFVGTVGTIEEDGTFVTGAKESIPASDGSYDADAAVFTEREGTLVSVRIEPEERVITARWGGIGCGRFGFMLFPLLSGDEVVVAVPDGDFNSDGISIVAAPSNRTAMLPEDWNNDRVLFDLNVPFEVRAPAVEINSGSLFLNGRKVNNGTEGI